MGGAKREPAFQATRITQLTLAVAKLEPAASYYRKLLGEGSGKQGKGRRRRGGKLPYLVGIFRNFLPMNLSKGLCAVNLRFEAQIEKRNLGWFQSDLALKVRVKLSLVPCDLYSIKFKSEEIYRFWCS